METFSKTYLSPKELVLRLLSRGLIIQDEQGAEAYITNIGYYRLSAYMYPFLQSPKTDHIFKRGVTFDQILNLYRYDKKLRILLFNEKDRFGTAIQLYKNLAD